MCYTVAMAYRLCSECPNTLEGKDITAKTCSTSCRSKRSRRLRRQKVEAGKAKAMPEHQREVTERVQSELPDVAHKVIEEEIRPVVRESITADTLKAISDMVALTPAAVSAIMADLSSEDAVIRQRAYTLVMKYTVGHQALVTPEDQDRTQPLQINFELPRPESAPTQEEVVDAEVVDDEVKQCDQCGKDAPIGDFIANSDRCSTCFREQQDRAAEILEHTARD